MRRYLTVPKYEVDRNRDGLSYSCGKANYGCAAKGCGGEKVHGDYIYRVQESERRWVWLCESCTRELGLLW